MIKNFNSDVSSKIKSGKRSIIMGILLLFGLFPLLAAPCGDVNSDNSINIIDALLTAQFYVGLNPQNFDEAAGDVNGDNSINIVDALLMAQYYVGLISEFTGCKEETPEPSRPPGTPGSLPKHWHETKGFGTTIKGGIAGEVYKVTNLNSSGPGSLKDAVSESNRLVVFEVGGVIEGGFIVASNVTIAGQTAPYPGITIIKGNVRTNTSDIVVSHITHHLGSQVDGYPDAWNVKGTNIVLDHVAVYWGKDETLVVGSSDDITLYKCIIAEGLQFTGHEDGEHSKGLHLQSGNTRVSVIGSLSVHSALRNPRMDGGEAFLGNYVLYNWGPGWDHRGDKITSDSEIPGCTQCYNYAVSARRNGYITLVGSVALQGPESVGEYFLSGHYGENAYAYINDNIIKDRNGNDLIMTDPAITVQNTPVVWPEGIDLLPADEALYEVLRTVGPQPGRRNNHNARIVKSVAEGTGKIIDSEEEVGGYPDYTPTRRSITVPDGAEARQAWLDELEDEIAVDTSIDLSKLYEMVGSRDSDRLLP